MNAPLHMIEPRWLRVVLGVVIVGLMWLFYGRLGLMVAAASAIGTVLVENPRSRREQLADCERWKNDPRCKP